MKNIYILPTDKPTRVHKDSELFISPKYQLSKSINSIVEGLNIYITSDDYIGFSWYIDTDSNRVRKGVIDDERYWKVRPDYKKIILTTDQDLIKEGVADLFQQNYAFIEYLIKHIDTQWAKVIPLMSNNGRALFGYKVETPGESLANMKCQCMQYTPGDFTSNCRVCGLQPKPRLGIDFEFTIDDEGMCTEIPIDTENQMGREAHEWAMQYQGTDKYTVAMLAIEFGYQLALKYESNLQK